MHTFLVVIHVVIGAFMILFVLLQAGKGGGGLAFGSSNSQSVFGASGAGNFLTKTTTFLAVSFFATSLSLTWLAARKASESVIQDIPAAAAPADPAKPADAPAPDAAPAAPGAAPATP